MRINILLPLSSKEPIGGLKVQYEYANRLSKMGFDVALYHSLGQPWVPGNIRTFGGLIRRNVEGRRQISWFPLAPQVRAWFVPKLHARVIRHADATVLTGFTTSEDIERCTKRTGVLLQIVYDYEIWRTSDVKSRDRIARAFQREDVIHVATSRAVEGMLDAMGVRADAYIPCGVDNYTLTDISPIADRQRIVGFPLRIEPHKGVPEILAAAKEIHKLYPDVTFEAFGNWLTAEVPAFITGRSQSRRIAP